MNIASAPIGFSLMFANEDQTEYFLLKPVGILVCDYDGEYPPRMEPLTTDPALGIILAKTAENYVGLTPDKEADGFFRDWLADREPKEDGPQHGVAE